MTTVLADIIELMEKIIDREIEEDYIIMTKIIQQKAITTNRHIPNTTVEIYFFKNVIIARITHPNHLGEILTQVKRN